MRRLLCVLALGISLVLLPAPASATTIERTPLYFADWTVSDWPVLDAVVRWNKNTKVVLKQVKTCEDWMQPCVTIVDKYDDNYVHRTYAGFYDYGSGYSSTDKEITLHNWIDEDMLPGLRWDYRRSVICHELGHYIFEPNAQHWDRGCMGTYASPDHPVPGKYNRSIIPSRSY